MSNEVIARRRGELGAAIRHQRELVGLTQGQLAQALGHDQSLVSRAEKGLRAMPVDALFSFAEALGCSPESLLVGIT